VYSGTDENSQQYTQTLEEMDRLEMRFAEALVVFSAIFFVVKYSAVDPSRKLPAGHSMASYVAAIDFMEGLLIRETDRMLNRIGQFPKKKIDGLLAVLETLMDLAQLRLKLSKA